MGTVAGKEREAGNYRKKMEGVVEMKEEKINIRMERNTKRKSKQDEELGGRKT